VCTASGICVLLSPACLDDGSRDQVCGTGVLPCCAGFTCRADKLQTCVRTTPADSGTVGSCAGEACTPDTVGCCAGFTCVGNHCELSVGGTCARESETCRRDDQCCAGLYCEDATPSAPDRHCRLGSRRGGAGTSCAFDAQCASLHCEGSVCGPGQCTTVGACTASTDCCDGATCTSGFCRFP
jgi:hypothetical protein